MANTWAFLSSVPEYLTHHACATDGHTALLCGGQGNEFSTDPHRECYTFDGLLWNQTLSLLMARTNFAMVNFGSLFCTLVTCTYSLNHAGKMYALGGIGFNGTRHVALASVEHYDPKNGWRMFNVSLGNPVAYFAAGILSG